MKKEKIKYHTKLLEIICKFQKPKSGKLISKNETFNGLKAQFKPYGKEFKIQFTYDNSSKKKDLDIGQYHKNIQIQFGDSIYNLESVFLGHHSLSNFTGSVHRIHTKGYSEKQKYYYQLVMPLEKGMDFHFNIDETTFNSDMVDYSRSTTTATLKGEKFQVCCIYTDKKVFYLVLDSQEKQTFDEFAKKADAVKIGIGYLTGYYAGNMGYYFAYTSKGMKEPKHFRFVQFRDSIKSGYCPIYSNAYGYLHHDKLLAKKYYPLLRSVSLKEFSLLCEKIHGSLDFASTLMLMLESSVASLLFMPGGYAIALETMSDLVIGIKKLKLAPIKDKTVSRTIRKEFLEVLNKLFIPVILTPHSGHTDPPLLRGIFEDKILKNDQWLFVSVKLFFFVFLSQRFSF